MLDLLPQMIKNFGMNGETLISMLLREVMEEFLIINHGPMIRNEQDTWNHIFHAKDKYTSEIIDQEGSGVTYGIINQWGEKDHCESWKKLYVKDD